MTREFEELTLDGHNYPAWVMDIKISLALWVIYEVITPPAERQQELLPTYKYNALYIIRHHIHLDFKSEYILEKNQVLFGLLFRIIMNNKRLWFC
jgi:hypothetical protein